MPGYTVGSVAGVFVQGWCVSANEFSVYPNRVMRRVAAIGFFE
jgi:hypothetical protein